MKIIVVLFLMLVTVGRSQSLPVQTQVDLFPYAAMEPCADRLVEWNSTLDETRAVFDSLKIKYKADKYGLVITRGNVHYRYQIEHDALTAINVVITCATRAKAEDLEFELRQRAYDTWIESFEEASTGKRCYTTKCDGVTYICLVEIKSPKPKDVWIVVFPDFD